MKLANNIKYLIAVIMLAVLGVGCDGDAGKALGISEASKDLSIGRMRVSIWPEYDEPVSWQSMTESLRRARITPSRQAFSCPKALSSAMPAVSLIRASIFVSFIKPPTGASLMR